MKRLVRNSPKREREGAAETNGGHKRAKLLKSDVTHECLLDVGKAKSLYSPQDEVSGSHNLDNQIPVLSENMESQMFNSNIPPEMKLPTEQMSSLTNGNGSIQIHENTEVGEQNEIIQQNGTSEEVVKASSSDSFVSELTQEPKSNSIAVSKLPQLNEDNVQMPVLNPENFEVHNEGDSTDSFQSDGFQTVHSVVKANKKDVGHFSSQEDIEPSTTQVPEVENCTLDPPITGEPDEEQTIVEPVLNKKTKQLTPKESLESTSEVFSARSLDIDSIDSTNFEVTQLEGHSEIIFSVAANEDFILSSSGDTTVKVWSMIDKSLICNFSGHQDSVTSVLLLTQSQTNLLKSKLKLSDDISRIAVTGSLDCNIKLWSVFEGQELASIYTFNGITCLDYLESELFVVVGTEGGKIELWDIFASKAVQSFQAHEESVSDIKVVDCNIYTVSSDGTVIVWLYEDEDLYPVYTRKRKRDQDLNPSQWKSVAVVDNLIYLGDKSNSIKVLDSRAGRLRHFWNQNQLDGICESIEADKDILLSSFYDAVTDTGGVNVWKIPELKYICTLTGEMQDVCSLALVRKENFLRVVTGGHQLLVWDFDFSKPSKSNSGTKDTYHITQLDRCGREIFKPSRVRIHKVLQEDNGNPDENAKKKWCNVM